MRNLCSPCKSLLDSECCEPNWRTMMPTLNNNTRQCAQRFWTWRRRNCCQMFKREKGKYFKGFFECSEPTLPSGRALWSHLSNADHLQTSACEREKANRFPLLGKATLYFICPWILLPGAYPQNSDLMEQHRGKEAGSLRTEPPGHQDSFKWFSWLS